MKTFALAALAVFLLSSCSSDSGLNDSSDAASHTPDSVDYAYMLCHAADSTNLQTEPCSVDTPNIDIHLATSAADAQQICAALAEAATEKGWVFESYWRLRILSPYASGGPIATCSL